MGRLDLKVELLAVGEGEGGRGEADIELYTILIKMFFINEIYNSNKNVYQRNNKYTTALF